MALEKLFEENETFELKGQVFEVISVGAHMVDEYPAGYSYAFRLKSEIEGDAEAQARAEQVEADRVAKLEEERLAAEAEENNEQEEE